MKLTSGVEEGACIGQEPLRIYSAGPFFIYDMIIIDLPHAALSVQPVQAGRAAAINCGRLPAVGLE
jgi:hypothetical protein